MSSQSQWIGEAGTLFVKFGWYLHKLEADEYMKPIDQRREIPSLVDLARATGFTPSSVGRIVKGDVVRLNLKLCHGIISEMRRRGFDMQITDIVDFIGPPLHKLHKPSGEAEQSEHGPTVDTPSEEPPPEAEQDGHGPTVDAPTAPAGDGPRNAED